MKNFSANDELCVCQIRIRGMIDVYVLPRLKSVTIECLGCWHKNPNDLFCFVMSIAKRAEEIFLSGRNKKWFSKNGQLHKLSAKIFFPPFKDIAKK